MPQRPNILIVDPSEQDMQLLEISLRNMKFAITTATNAFDALKKVEIFPPDLIIAETNVEDFDGFELCKNIKENDQWAQIPFIFLTSDKDLKSKVKGLQLGVDDYLTKPIFLVELVARIKMLMQKKERESIEKQESRTRFTGSLSEIGIVDIIQTIDLSKKKGVVHLAHDGETGAIYFEDGDIVDAELAQQEGEDAVYRMMRWSEGFFDIDFRPIRREKKISVGVQQLLMEGLRRLDEWNRILEQLPPMATIFNVDVLELIDRLDEIPDEVNGLVALFDGQRSLEEVVSNDIFTDLDTLRIVSKLIFFGVLIEHEQKTRAVERPEDDEVVIVGAAEGERERKSTDSMGVPVTAPQDLQFGKAEDVDIVEAPAGAKGPAAEEAEEEKAEAVEAKAEEEAQVEKEEKKEEKEEKKEARAEADGEKKVIGRISIKKVPVEVISKGPQAPAEKLTPKKSVIIGEKAAEVREKTAQDDEDTVRKRVEELGAETMKTAAPSIPSTPEKDEGLPSEMKEGRVEEEVLSAIDSKIQQLKEGKVAEEEEEKKAADKDEVAEKEGETPREEGREAPTARMYSKDAAKEKDVEEALKEKLTARWTFPVSGSGEIAQKLKGEREEAKEEGREEALEEGKEKEDEKEEAARAEGKQHIEEEPARQEEVRKGMVQAISLNEVKEEIEKREKEGEEKKVDKKKEMSESGAYSVEDKEFFRSAPTGDEQVDTFEDLDFSGKGKKEESTKGLTYAIWTIILLGIAGVLFLVFGKDLFKQGPDLTLLDKLEEVEPVSTKPLMEKSMEELSPMEGEEEGEETAPQPGQEEGEGEEQASSVAEGTEEAAEGAEEAAEGTEEAAEGTEEGMETEPPVAPAADGAYAALLAKAKDLMEKKKKKEGVEKLKEAVAANPDGQEALSMLVDIYREKPKPEVLAWGKKATQLGPNDTRAWFGYGLALFTKGKIKEAKPVFEHCIEIEPSDSNTNNCKKMLKWCK